MFVFVEPPPLVVSELVAPAPGSGVVCSGA